MKWLGLVISFFNQLRGKAVTIGTSEPAQKLRTHLIGEAVIGIVTFGVGYLVSHCTNQTTLQTCQDERATLLKQHGQHQALIDSLHFSAKLAQKDQQILQKDEEILLLSQRIRSDSIAHLSELEAMRAINAAIKRKR